jgi:eukaryotic-like serine/threonine-protein kinase
MLPLNHVLQNRYRILRPLGKGGMGHVYEAMDDAVDCIVAIKETFADTDRMRRAFEREAKLLANLRHPTLPRVTHHFIEGGTQFLVMDYVEGLNLLELLALRKQAFSSAEVLPWADRLLSALEYLHSRPQPVVHRDIKPANIKLTKDGEVYLLDFGLAKGAAGQMSTMDPDQSAFASVYGYTAAYAPLEQLTNSGTNAQSDLYSLGATLYHLLAGQAPVSANVRYEALEMDAADPLPAVHQLNAQVPGEVSQVIAHAMAMSRRDRLRSANEMRAALQEANLRARELVETRVKETQLESHPVSAADQSQQVAQPEQIGATALSPTVAATPAVPIQSSPPMDQRTIKVTPPVVSSPRPDSQPSAEVSWPSQINTSDSHVGASEERTPVANPPPNLSEGAILGRSSEAPVSTMVSGSQSAPDLRWQQPVSLRTRILGPAPEKIPRPVSERPPRSIARIIAICVIVALVAITAVAILLAITSSTGNRNSNTTTTNSTNVGPSSNASRPSTPTSYSFQKNLQNNQGVVWAVAFTPSGSHVVTAGDDHRIRYYDAHALNATSEPTGDWAQTSVINSIAVSPDGKYIASASNDRTVSLKGFQNAPVTLTGHQDEVYFVAFSPDSKLLASASKDKTVRIWDVQSQREIKTLAGHSDVVWSVAFSPNGNLLASASKDKTIKIWDTRTWEPLRTLTAHTSAVISLAFSPSGDILATGSDDNTIKLWDTFKLEEVKTLAGHSSYITSLAFSADGKTLASASNDQTVRLWNMETGLTRQVLAGHSKGVTSVSFSPDAKTIVTGGRDQTVKVWQ